MLKKKLKKKLKKDIKSDRVGKDSMIRGGNENSNNQQPTTNNIFQSPEPRTQNPDLVGSYQLPNYQITKLPNHHQSSAEINIYIKPTGEIIVYGWNTKLDEIVQETDLIHPGFKLIKGNKIYCG